MAQQDKRDDKGAQDGAQDAPTTITTIQQLTATIQAHKAQDAVNNAHKRATMATYNHDAVAHNIALHASAVALLKQAGLSLDYKDAQGKTRTTTYASERQDANLYNTLVAIVTSAPDLFYNTAQDGVTVTSDATSDDNATSDDANANS